MLKRLRKRNCTYLPGLRRNLNKIYETFNRESRKENKYRKHRAWWAQWRAPKKNWVTDGKCNWYYIRITGKCLINPE